MTLLPSLKRKRRTIHTFAYASGSDDLKKKNLMSTTSLPTAALRTDRSVGLAFGACALGFVIAAAAIAGFLPIQFSIVSVFLCAGPHNWVEARYFLSRLPARWGRLRGFFLLGFAGVLALTAGFAGLPHLLTAIEVSEEA